MTRRVDFRLLRHPQKVFGTGELTQAGHDTFKTLLLRVAREDYDLVYVYLTPHPKRGRPLLPIATTIAGTSRKFVKPRICAELYGRFNEFSPADSTATWQAILQREIAPAKRDEPGLYEPWSEEEEALITSTLVHKHWDVPLPGPIGLSGRDIGREIQAVVDYVVTNMRDWPPDCKILLLAISHSGIIEQFIKLVYLANKQEKNAQEVTVDDIGGLVDFLEGPTLRISQTGHSHPTVQLVYKDLLLQYRTAGRGKMTLEP